MLKSICSIFKSSIFWVIITALYCLLFNVLINILIAYLWSYLINKFIPSSYLFVKYFIIIILFFYNYFVLRKIVLSWAFEWQHPFQIFSIYKERQNYLNFLNSRLNEFINTIEALINGNISKPIKELESIDSFLYIFNEEYNRYNKLFFITNNNDNNNNIIRYKMSKCQIRYYNLLKQINDIINKNNFKKELFQKVSKRDKYYENENNNIIDTDNSSENSNNINPENLNQLLILLNQYKKIISEYNIINYTYMSPAYLFNLFSNDTFGSLSLYSLQFKKNFEKYILEENFTPNGKIHYTLIRNKNKNENENKNEDDDKNNSISNENNNLIIENSNNNLDDGPLLIFCLPNGALYELIPKSKINFYMENGFSFLVWNYNGYGYSKGSPNFKNIKTNVLELYDIIVKNPRYNFKKICVMGHSIGGVAAFYLAKNRHVDLLISDRNFCDLPRIVRNWYCGSILNFLVKSLFIGNTDNINNFFNSNLTETYKIIIYSPLDALILNDATAKSGISRYILKNYIIYKNRVNSSIIKNKENILDFVFTKNEKEVFLNDFLELMHLHFDNNDENIIYGDDNFAYNEQDLENQERVYYTNNLIKKGNLTQSETDVLFSFYGKFFGVSCDDLNILVKMKVSPRREKIFIDNFFNNLLIWGMQGGDDKNEEYFEFHSFKGQKILKEANELLIEYISTIHQIDKTKNSILIEKVSKNISKILDVMDNLDVAFEKNNNQKINKINDDNIKEQLISNNEENIEINTNKIVEDSKNDSKTNSKGLNNFYDKLDSLKGNTKLMKTYAGHNGSYLKEEIEQFYIFLLSSNVIS